MIGTGGLALTGCGRPDPARYNDTDRALLAGHAGLERERSGQGPFGRHVYRGYRGLAELPWFELDAQGILKLVDDSVPDSIDFHAHLGMSLLFEPNLDLTAATDRVRHLLDCDGEEPGCELDLDLYINGNFKGKHEGRPKWKVHLLPKKKGMSNKEYYKSMDGIVNSSINDWDMVKANRVEERYEKGSVFYLISRIVLSLLSLTRF